MKKIVIVTDAWHPQVNGVVRVLEAQIPHIKALGYEVELIESSQFKTVPLPLYPEIRMAVFPKKRVEALLRGADAVHIVTEGSLGLAARKYCMRNHVPFTTWYHTHYHLYISARIPGVLKLVEFLLKKFHTPAVRTMVSTNTLRESLEKMGFTHLSVVPLGVDTEHFVRNSILPPLPKPVFVYFGRLASEKSPEDFLRLDLSGTKLVIGDGPLRAALEKKYKTALFAGYKKGQELVDWLSLAQVFVFPSRTETFGLVTLEALSCGIPVAAYDVMGPRDIITNGKDGYLSDNLADAAQKCLTLSPVECRNKALQYSWSKSADEFIKNLHWIQKAEPAG
ncbi:glycosyltransferase family 1 protein [Candidatus Parcubacteria bacterium]|nr:glycosyltransferase family 1 protein [Candidatus Parcubacteria bacterium]